MPGVSSLGGNSPSKFTVKKLCTCAVAVVLEAAVTWRRCRLPFLFGDFRGTSLVFFPNRKTPVGWSSVTFQWRIQMELKLGFLQPLPDTKVKVIEFYLKEKCEVSYLGSFTCSHVRFNPREGESSNKANHLTIKDFQVKSTIFGRVFVRVEGQSSWSQG